MEESLSSEDELWENSKADVNTAATASATGGKGKKTQCECFSVFTLIKIKT